MSTKKSLKQQQQSMVDSSEQSRGSKTGFKNTGNSGLSEGISKTKNK